MVTIEEATRLHEHVQMIDDKATRLKMIADLTGGPLGKSLDSLAEEVKATCQSVYKTFWNQND